jgi:hypothetical protein
MGDSMDFGTRRHKFVTAIGSQTINDFKLPKRIFFRKLVDPTTALIKDDKKIIKEIFRIFLIEELPNGVFKKYAQKTTNNPREHRWVYESEITKEEKDSLLRLKEVELMDESDSIIQRTSK